MAMSGINVEQEVVDIFQLIKNKKGPKFVAFRLSNNKKSVIVDHDIKGEKIKTTDVEEDKKHFQKLLDMQKDEEPRYIIYDFGFKQEDGKINEKLAFISWCSDNCPVSKKMVFSATKDTVVKKCDGVHKVFQINDKGDLDYDEMKKEMETKA